MVGGSLLCMAMWTCVILRKEFKESRHTFEGRARSRKEFKERPYSTTTGSVSTYLCFDQPLSFLNEKKRRRKETASTLLRNQRPSASFVARACFCAYLLTLKDMRTVGSSTAMGFIGSGVSLSTIVSPMPMNSSPATMTISPALAFQNKRRIKKRDAQARSFELSNVNGLWWVESEGRRRGGGDVSLSAMWRALGISETAL
jgi:hypothetical protein